MRLVLLTVCVITIRVVMIDSCFSCLCHFCDFLLDTAVIMLFSIMRDCHSKQTWVKADHDPGLEPNKPLYFSTEISPDDKKEAEKAFNSTEPSTWCG